MTTEQACKTDETFAAAKLASVVPTKVLIVSPLGPDSAESDERPLTEDGYVFEHVYLDACNSHLRTKLVAGFRPRVIQAMRRSAIIISADANVTLSVAAAMYALRIRRPHFALTFNLVNRRRFHPAVDWIARLVLPTIDFFVTPSDIERHHFSQAYGIPIERFAFSHWGVASVPAPKPEALPPAIAKQTPYYCAIGRNNRDFATFCEALRGAPYNGVIVTMPGLVDTTNLPPNVQVHYNLSFDACHACVEASIANVIPLKDPHIGAGHITMVFAMHRGIPQIVTRADAVADYFMFDSHGIGVEIGSVQSLREAMDRMYGCRDTEGERMGQRAREFAQRWLSDNEINSMLRLALRSLRTGESLPTAPLGWKDRKPMTDDAVRSKLPVAKEC